MSSLRCTVVMKTDLRDFTARVGGLSQTELARLLHQHQQLVRRTVAAHQGQCLKGEGDAFWLLFPSVTAAALAAATLHAELMQAQSGAVGPARLAVRVVITLGDVLHQDGDVFGDAVNLAGRLEEITPPDETYLSEAAWLALNKAEAPAAFVGEFSLRGFSDPQRVYRLTLTHTTRVLEDQIVVASDLEGYSALLAVIAIERIERLLLHLEALHLQACEAYGGRALSAAGDCYILAFPAPVPAVAAAEALCSGWDRYIADAGLPCRMLCGVHRGPVYLFRSFAFGGTINLALRLIRRDALPGSNSGVTLSEPVADGLSGTPWASRLREVELPPRAQLSRSEPGRTFILR